MSIRSLFISLALSSGIWVGCSPQVEGATSPPPAASSPAAPTVTVSTASLLLGYALSVPGTGAVITVDEAFLRGERRLFNNETSGTLSLLSEPLKWQPSAEAAEYIVLVVETAQLARSPALYLVLLERSDASLKENAVMQLGERRLLVGLELKGETLQVRTLDERLGRPPATGRLEGELYVFGFSDGEFKKLK